VIYDFVEQGIVLVWMGHFGGCLFAKTQPANLARPSHANRIYRKGVTPPMQRPF
jgi:hypothetical protein